MKKIVLVIMLLSSSLSLCACNNVKILVPNISMAGTGDNYNISPAKIEVSSIKINSVVKIPITIANDDKEAKTYQLKVVAPLKEETSSRYTAYPVRGISTFFNQDTITVEGGKVGVVNFYIAKIDKIPNTQVWVNVSVETNHQITSAYIVNILIKGDIK
jgi:hypothetical protein